MDSKMASSDSELKFKIEDYVMMAVTLLVSTGLGLYVSIVRHKQSSVTEYFLAGRNVNVVVVLLSYFSSYAAGAMSFLAIETYLYGAQPMLYIIAVPFVVCFVHYLVVPVFYRLNNISMLKYFEIRFGRTVSTITLIATIVLMVSAGSINVYVAALVIQQVSALNVWVAASIMTIACIIYSTLGGMRGIVLADAIQAVIMIIAILFVFIMGVVQSGGPKAIWDTNNKYGRTQFFDFRTDPTIRHTFWSAVIGFNIFNVCHISTNQSLLQRCLMAPNLKTAQKIASIGATMTLLYMLIYSALGVVMFGFYNGCHVVHSGAMQRVDQLPAYFAMNILHQFRCLPGIYFSGYICAALSTISSVLNAISAVIMENVSHRLSKVSDGMATLICKVIVATFGGIMSLGLVVIGNFPNAAQAGITLISIIAGPIFALYCIGILCPQANHKAAAVSMVAAMLVSVWIVVGSVVTSPVSATPPFASNCSLTNVNVTLNFKRIAAINDIDAYFPLSKVSYIYNCSEGIATVVICFIITSIIIGIFKKEDDQPVSQLTLDLIPKCIRRLQLKMSKRMRRLLLCDVYDENNAENSIMTEIKHEIPN